MLPKYKQIISSKWFSTSNLSDFYPLVFILRSIVLFHNWTHIQQKSWWNTCRPNICLILPRFTSHIKCAPLPTPSAGSSGTPLTVEPNKKGARVPDFLLLPGSPYHLRCFHSSAALLCRFNVMQLLWLDNTEACHLCCCFRSSAILHKSFPTVLLLLSWSACLAEGPGPCYLCTLTIGWCR